MAKPYYSNKEKDELFDKLMSVRDKSEEAKLWARIHEIDKSEDALAFYAWHQRRRRWRIFYSVGSVICCYCIGGVLYVLCGGVSYLYSWYRGGWSLSLYNVPKWERFWVLSAGFTIPFLGLVGKKIGESEELKFARKVLFFVVVLINVLALIPTVILFVLYAFGVRIPEGLLWGLVLLGVVLPFWMGIQLVEEEKKSEQSDENKV